MKWFLAFLILIAPMSASASRSSGFGLGIILGEPTGVSLKFWQNSNRAIDAAVSYSFVNFLLVHADYLFHFPGAFRSGRPDPFFQQLSPYLGVGGVLLVAGSGGLGRAYFSGTSSIGFGLRVPFGIEWLPNDPPLGVFVELVPGIGVIPTTFGFIQGGIGIRYYF